MLMHACDKELTSLLARLHATDGTPVGSVLWDYYTGNFDRKWYVARADEGTKILATLNATNISKGHIALKLFIDECRHSATDKLDFRTFHNVRATRDRWNVVDAELQAYVDALDETHSDAKAAFTHLHTEMIRFTAHYSPISDHTWNHTNGVW